MSKPHFMKKGLAALLAFSVVASAGGSALAAGVPVADAAGEEGVYQTAPDTEVRPAAPSVAVTAPESGLRFDSVKQEYAEMSDTVAIPQTAEIWVNLDPGENRRQIIFNNYQNGTEDSWGLEVTVDNTLRYWERVDGTQTSLLFDDVEICTGEWMLVSVVRDLDSGKVLVYINGEYVTEQDASNLNDGTQLTHALRFGTDTRNQYWLDGEIGEVRFWDDMRSAEEIAQYAGQSVDGSEDGLAHAWVLDEVEGLGPDTVFEDLAGNVDVTAEGFRYEMEEPDGETTEPFTIDFEDGTAGTWRTLESGEADAAVEDGVLVLNDMAQNEPVFLTGADGGEAPYLSNAVYEVRAKVSGSDDPVFGIAFRGSIRSGAANWLALRGEGQDTLLAQTTESWDDPWTDAHYALQPDTWYDLRYTFIGKSVKVEVKADGEDSYTTLVDGSAETVWDGWGTGAGYIGFCGWGDTQDYYIDSITVTPQENNQTHTVTFDLNGGTGDVTGSVTVADGGTVAQPEGTPEREGFTFTGWYKDIGCTQAWDFSEDVVWKDTTIYAGWKYTYQSAGFEDMAGVSFDDPGDQLAMEEKLSAVPLSFEATIKLPSGLEERGGVIIGNYMDAGYYDYDLGYVNFEIYDNGAPRLYWSQERRNQPGGDTQSVVFSNVDLRQDEWVHLAITFDPASDTARCYVNGVLVSTVDNCRFEPVIPAQALKVGGDYRGTGGQVTDSGYNTQYFKGEIANASIWSTVRTEEQIAADVAALQESAANVPQAQDGLLGSWSFADADANLYADLSGNGNDVAYFVDWIDPDFAEGDYSMAALPDTQFLSQNYPDIYKELTRWITVNKEEYNIQAVMHMGDMVNSGTSAQWTAADEAMDILDTKDIPWMPMRGNHDPSDGFNQTFPYEEFASRDYFGGSYEHEVLGQDKLDSTYWEITAGGREYLILSLGWAPTQEAIDWAEQIVANNPDKNVILTAHAFMYWDGTHLNDEDLDYTSGYTDTGIDGSKIWEQIGSKYGNVVLAMGGHIGFPDIIARTDENGAGEEVTSLLCDAQGIDLEYGLGMMALLTFHEDSNEVDVNWYSAHEGKLFRTRNQFTIEVPHVGETAAEITVAAVDAQDAVTAYVGTAQDGLGLPETVGVTLPDGSKAALPVTWTCADYDADRAGTYTFTGTLGSAEGVSNPDGLTAQITVTLQNRSTGGGSSSGGSGSSSSNRPDASVSGAGGKVSASSNGTITITPDDGYEISKITVNGEEVDIPADGRLTGLDKNDKVVVTFARITDEQPEEPDGNATPFADVSDSAWYAEAVQYVYENGMMNGTDDTAFSPDANTTRAMIVTMLYRMEAEPTAQGSGFTDVAAGSYYADAVAWAAENGIVNGVSETSFAPDDSITREQMAAILYRYAQYKGYDVSTSGSLGAYTDAAQVSGYAAAAMQWANGEGLITGVTGTTLDPQGSATRAQVATILMRFCEGIAG